VWVLDQSSWNALLARLGPDPHSAGVAYDALHRQLVRFFEWHGCMATEEHADTALTRVARKIQEGEHVLNVPAYALAVARYVLREVAGQRKPSPFNEAIATGPAVSPASEEREQPAACLDSCLEQLPQRSRELVLQYYEGEGRRKIANHRTMADHLGITERALRLRVFRIRGTLEQCVHRCLHSTEGQPHESRV
jgi:DNA-directed RNA polymerase specialized sigma24 family protein